MMERRGAAASAGAGRLLVVLLLLALTAEAFRIPSACTAPKPAARSALTRLQALRKADHYEVLGIAPGATPEEVKRAYRERAKNTHPDASRTQDTVSEFMKVKEAYETLYDAQRRADFDRKRKIAEVTELAANVGEILATDLAIPLARDVALPLIKASIKALDQTLIQQVATPFLQRTMTEARAAMDTLRQASEDRVLHFSRLQAAWRAEEIKQLSAQLEEATKRAKLAQDQALAASELLALAADGEQLSRAKLEEELRTGGDIAQRTAALHAASASALARFQAKAGAEELAKRQVRKLKAERRRVYVATKSAETLALASQAEVDEAEEVLRRAQARAAKAREAHAKASEVLSQQQAAAAAVAEDLQASSARLEAAAAEVAPEKVAWEGVQEEEKALQQAYFRHTKAERALRLEVGSAVRRRESTGRELEKAREDTARFQQQVMELAAAIEKKYQEAQTGSGIGASSTASASASSSSSSSNNKKASSKAEQKESFEAVMGKPPALTPAVVAMAATEQGQEDKAAAAAQAAAAVAAEEDAEAAARRQMKEEWVRQQQELLHEDLQRASEAALAAAAAAREDANLNVLSGIGI